MGTMASGRRIRCDWRTCSRMDVRLPGTRRALRVASVERRHTLASTRDHADAVLVAVSTSSAVGRGMVVQAIWDLIGPWASVGLLLLVIVLRVRDLIGHWHGR